MEDYSKHLSWQKSQPNLKISYNLDYDPKSIWEIPALHAGLIGLPFYVQEVGFTIAHENYYVRRANMDAYMLCYQQTGESILEYNGCRTLLRTGDCMWIDCRKVHFIYTAKDCHEIEIYFVHLYGDGAAKYNEQFQKMNASGCITGDGNTEIPFYFRKILDLYRHGSRTAMTDLSACSYLSMLCLAMLNLMHKQINQEIPDFVRDAIRFIETDYSNPITLDILSQKYFLSKSYFQKQFKKHTGLSPNAYLKQIRMEQAKKLLRMTNNPIHEIAHHVGIHDTSYFVHVFHQLENMTPLEYRKFWNNI